MTIIQNTSNVCSLEDSTVTENNTKTGKEYNYLDEALQLAAQCWCDKETEMLTMDPVLCSAVAKRIGLWMETAAQNQRNANYYRHLLVQCGQSIGVRSYTCDDGTLSNEVLCTKIPEIIANDYIHSDIDTL